MTKECKCRFQKVTLLLHLVQTCFFIPPISPAEVRSLWAQLRHDEPHLLSNFEDFLARVTSQIVEANQEKSEMESALKRSGHYQTIQEAQKLLEIYFILRSRITSSWLRCEAAP